MNPAPDHSSPPAPSAAEQQASGHVPSPQPPGGRNGSRLLIAFIQKEDAGKLLKKLREENISVTSLESEGGFLRRRNATVFIAVADDEVPGTLAIIKDVCRARTERVDTTFATGDVGSVELPTPTEIPVGGATVLILDIAEVLKI